MWATVPLLLALAAGLLATLDYGVASASPGGMTPWSSVNFSYFTPDHPDPLDPNHEWDCKRPWPSVGIVIPLFIPGRGSNYTTRHYWPADWLPEHHQIFLRGIIMYWPWKLSGTKLTVMCDAERKDSIEFKEDVTDVLTRYKALLGDDSPPFRVAYNDPLPNVYRNGHDRQQYLTFTADYYTDAEYVAFMDSDALLHSYVDREDLFEGGKAIIMGRLSHQNYKPWTKKTFEALGVEEHMSCMSYWPMIIKRAHLPEIREAIRKQRNKATFEEAFWDFSYDMVGAQFNMMCTWIFLHKRDEYVFRLKDATPEWNGFSNPRPPNGMWSDKSVFRPEELHPLTVPYLAQHISYVMEEGKLSVLDKTHVLMRKSIERIMHAGMCHAGTKDPKFVLLPNATELSHQLVSRVKEHCPALLANHAFHQEQLRFEMYDLGNAFSHDEKTNMQRARANRIKNCEHTYYMI